MRGIMLFNKDRLTQALNARGMTQTTLCALTGYSSGTVSKWVSGTQLPEYSAIEKIAAALNVKESWLMKPMVDLGQDVNFFRSNVFTTKTVRKMAEVRLEKFC